MQRLAPKASMTKRTSAPQCAAISSAQGPSETDLPEPAAARPFVLGQHPLDRGAEHRIRERDDGLDTGLGWHRRHPLGLRRRAEARSGRLPDKRTLDLPGVQQLVPDDDPSPSR